MATESLPLVRSLTMYQGETWRRYAWRYRPGDVPQDFAGWSGRAQIRDSFADDNIVVAPITVTLGVDPETGDPGDGWIVPTLTAVESADVPVGSYKWDLELVGPSGSVLKFARGSFRVEGEATK